MINTANVAIGEFNTSFGRLFINNSTVINTGTFFLGEQTGATGHTVQNGGSVTITGQFRVGHWPQAEPVAGFGTTSTYVLNAGTVALTAAPGALGAESNGNAYIGIDSTGELTINGGTFTTGGLVLDNRAATAGVDTFNLKGGTLNVGQNGISSPNFADLSTYAVNLGGGTVHMTASSTSTVAATLTGSNGSVTFDVDGGVSSTWTGPLSGTGGLNKTGAGTLALSAVNSASGQVSVTGGTLLAAVASGSSTGSGGVVVGPSGTLGGTGTVGDGSAITVSVSGKIAPGATGPGTLTFDLGSTGILNITGAVTPAASQSLIFELGTSAAASDRITLSTGRLTMGTGVLGIDDFAFTLLPGFITGTYTLFDSSGAINGTLGANFSGVIAPGFTGTLLFVDGGRDLAIQIIPEPTSAAALIAAGTLLGMRRRRRS
jgi:autotransporter-associated beta strand protein